MMKTKLTQLIILLAFCWQATFALPVKVPADDSAIKLFTYKMMLAIYDYDYKNLIERQRHAATYFTGEGWSNFQNALIKSNLITNVKKNKYSVTSVPLAPPKIVKQGLNSGVYNWQVEMPAMVVYKNDSYQQVQYINIKADLAFHDKVRVKSIVTSKTKPINCQQNSSNITVSEPPSTTNSKKKNKKKK